jgi:ribonuclease HI
MLKRMSITIVADASYCPDHKLAGYGYWIASSRGKQAGGGVCGISGEVANNTVAEMMAVCNALWHALKSNLLQSGDRLLIQTDCLAAIGAFDGSRSSLNQQERDAVHYMRNASSRYDIEIFYRHVKGHSATMDARSESNRRCDAKAKECMREERSRYVASKFKPLEVNYIKN